MTPAPASSLLLIKMLEDAAGNDPDRLLLVKYMRDFVERVEMKRAELEKALHERRGGSVQ